MPATITSVAGGGAWSATGTWVGGVVPGTGDTAVIATTGTNKVTITAAESVGSVTINSSAILMGGPNDTYTLTVSGTLLNNGTLSADTTSGDNGTLSVDIAGNFTNDGTFTSSNGTHRFLDVVLDGSATQTISGTGSTTFNNLTISNTSTAVTATNSYSVNATLTVNASAELLRRLA